MSQRSPWTFVTTVLAAVVILMFGLVPFIDTGPPTDNVSASYGLYDHDLMVSNPATSAPLDHLVIGATAPTASGESPGTISAHEGVLTSATSMIDVDHDEGIRVDDPNQATWPEALDLRRQLAGNRHPLLC